MQCAQDADTISETKSLAKAASSAALLQPGIR
jgi:hypothetical protein